MVPSWFLGALLGFEWVRNDRVLDGLKVIAGISVVVAVMTFGVSAGAVDGAADVVGMGWDSLIGCVTCMGDAGFVVAGGPDAILTALYYPGGAYLSDACFATCIAAMS